MARTRLRGVELVGTRIAIEVPSNLDWSWSGEAIEHFSCSPESPDVYVGVRIGVADAVPSDGIVYESGGHTFEVGRRVDDWVIAVHGRGRFERVAVFDDSFSEGEVVVSPSAAAAGVAPFGHPLDEIVALHRVVRAGGLIVRGSAVPRDQRALLFLGSAQAPAADGCWGSARSQRLDGDRLALLPAERGIRLCGTPWHSDPLLSRPFSVSLDAVHVIEPARALFAERQDDCDAIQALLAHALAPVHDPACADWLLEGARRVTSQVPVLRLGLPEEKRVLPFTWGGSEAALAFAPPAAS
jgi:hypothetical protein